MSVADMERLVARAQPHRRSVVRPSGRYDG